MSTIRRRSPLEFLLDRIVESDLIPVLQSLESFWEAEGAAISATIDRWRTPWLRMFNARGERVDEILYPPSYRRALLTGYQAGIISRVFETQSVTPFFKLGFLTACYDPGLYCPYTVSLSTAVPLEKYGTPELARRFLPAMLRQDDQVWQGATWMTEIGGGSDLGGAVKTSAHSDGQGWKLRGEKYFASNAGAELAIVAARPEGSTDGVRGLALFLVPRWRDDGRLNYLIRRLKDKIGTRSVPTGEVEFTDSQAYLLGQADQGIYMILEALNISRVANSIASIAVAYRAWLDAHDFASQRLAFGKAVIEHPLLARQFADRLEDIEAGFALAWEAVERLDQVWRLRPPYPQEVHHFRLITHLAKYWTAELAVRTAKWGMEVFGGLGTLEEFPAERWLREAMILPIWEGTPHRQILDGLEAMEGKQAHEHLFAALAPFADPHLLEEMAGRVDEHLSLPTDQREALAEPVFSDLAAFTAHTLRRRPTIDEGSTFS
jgi:acyl-CoA dehydrogenase